jgi:hypothetical protein
MKPLLLALEAGHMLELHDGEFVEFVVRDEHGDPEARWKLNNMRILDIEEWLILRRAEQCESLIQCKREAK